MALEDVFLLSVALCLNKEEWTSQAGQGGPNLGDVDIDTLRCFLNELGPAGSREFWRALDGAPPAREMFTASRNCGLELEVLLKEVPRPSPTPTAAPVIPTAVPTPTAAPAPTAIPAATAAPASTAAPAPTAVPVTKAPDFELPFYGNRAGEPGLRLSDLRGTPVVLNFWFAGCSPCRPTMSAIETLYKSGRWAEVQFLGIQIPLGAEQLDPDRGQAFAAEMGISYFLVFDAEGEVSGNYGITGIPATFVLDSSHNIVRRWTGVLDENALENLIGQIARPSVAPTPAPTAAPATTPAPGNPLARYGGKLSLAVGSDPFNDNFSPFDGQFIIEKAQVNSLIFSRLMRRSASGIAPDLAAWWEGSADGREWTVGLRENARFHDGRPVNAEDVLYSIEAMDGRFNRLPDFANLEVIADFTLRVDFTEPFWDFPSRMAEASSMIVPRGMLEADIRDFTHLVGSGPFSPVEYRRDSIVALERNPDYYETGLPYLDRISIYVIADRTTRFANFLTGNLSYFGYPYSSLPALTPAQASEASRADSDPSFAPYPIVYAL